MGHGREQICKDESKGQTSLEHTIARLSVYSSSAGSIESSKCFRRADTRHDWLDTAILVTGGRFLYGAGFAISSRTLDTTDQRRLEWEWDWKTASVSIQ